MLLCYKFHFKTIFSRSKRPCPDNDPQVVAQGLDPEGVGGEGGGGGGGDGGDHSPPPPPPPLTYRLDNRCDSNPGVFFCFPPVILGCTVVIMHNGSGRSSKMLQCKTSTMPTCGCGS